MGQKRVGILLILLMSVCMMIPMKAYAQEEMLSIGIEAPYVVLMEASTGTILYEKDAHTAVPPASVTKIMTMLLIFEALEEQKIKLDDMVTISEKAASMGGSQVFLEPNEQQTVETLLKCIAVASANDACVAYRSSRQKANPYVMYAHKNISLKII